MKTASVLTAILFLFGFCNNKSPKPPCHYNLNQLLVSDAFGGTYTFDKNKNLRYYAFMIDSLRYQYSEDYDINGNLIQKRGKPLVMYRLQKQKNDTVSFVFSLFALNKKYGGIQVISNRGNTIEPGFCLETTLTPM